MSSRKSKRLYINQKAIKSGKRLNGWQDAVHVAVKQAGLLKGRCFVVGSGGIYVGPNNRYITDYGLNKDPQILLSDKGKKFVADFDKFGSKTQPTHITLIDERGEYL